MRTLTKHPSVVRSRCRCRSTTPQVPLLSLFYKSFCKRQQHHKSVNLCIILVVVKNKLMDLWGC